MRSWSSKTQGKSIKKTKNNNYMHMPEYDKGNIFKQQSIMNNITHLQHVAIIIKKESLKILDDFRDIS